MPGLKTIYLLQWTEHEDLKRTCTGQWNWLIHVLTQVTLIQGFGNLLIVIGDWFKAKQHVITQQVMAAIFVIQPWSAQLYENVSYNYSELCPAESNDHQTAGYLQCNKYHIRGQTSCNLHVNLPISPKSEGLVRVISNSIIYSLIIRE